MTYKVLIPCRSDKSGKVYKVGATVTEKDFPKHVIAAWLKQDPPVLAEDTAAEDTKVKPKGKEDNNNGSDTGNG